METCIIKGVLYSLISPSINPSGHNGVIIPITNSSRYATPSTMRTLSGIRIIIGGLHSSSAPIIRTGAYILAAP